MNHTKFIQRFFVLPRVTLFTAALLVLLGGFLFASGQAGAATPRDSLIKVAGPSSTLYYLSYGGARYVFPNEGTFYSWFTGFSQVYEVSVDELTTYPLAGNVTYRPGIRLVKIQTDPKVYAVARGGVLRWLTSETVAQRLYGSDWNQKVDDVPDAFFVNYTIGDPIYSDSDYDPLDEADQSDSVGADKGLQVGQGPHRGDTAPDVGNAAQIRAMNPQSCEADTWTCGSWSSCPQGLQTRSCVLSNDCPGVETPIPTTARSCTAEQSCTADTWSCGDWATCSQQGYQTRTCEMTYDCPQYQTPSPATGQACTPPADETCTEDVWECGDWSSCPQGLQTRTCEMVYDCPQYQTSSPYTAQACVPDDEDPFVYVEITDGVSSHTASPGDDYVPMLEFTVRPENTDLQVFNISAFGWIDADNDGVFARTEENGVNFAEVVDECAVFEGEDNLGVFQSVGETYYGDAMAGASLMAYDYNISEGVTKTLTFKCNLLETAGNHAVALVFEAQETLGAVQGIISESTMLTHEYQTEHPLNGDGIMLVDVAVTVEGEPEEELKPTVSLVSLPSSLFTAGDVTAMRFNIAAPGDRVAVRHLTFELALSTAGYTSVVPTAESSVREVGSPSNIPGGARLNSGLPCDSQGQTTICLLEVGFDDNLIIDALDWRTFDLNLNILASSFGDVLSVRLLGDEIAREGRLMMVGGNYDYRVSQSDDNFVWYDMEGIPAVQTTIDEEDYHWMNGTDIFMLPSDAQTLAN